MCIKIRISRVSHKSINDRRYISVGRGHRKGREKGNMHEEVNDQCPSASQHLPPLHKIVPNFQLIGDNCINISFGMFS
jgi:hypothetical protein